MSGAVLFEHSHRGHRWRLEIVDYKGRSYANWRKWFDANGTWRPTREGCTIPLDGLWELTAALMAQHGLPVPERPKNGA